MMRLHILLAASALALAGCSDRPLPSDIVSMPVALYPGDPERLDAGELIYAGGVSAASADPRFGGWSAIHVSADGKRLLALSDRGTWMTARLAYDEDGWLTGLEQLELADLLGPDGRSLQGSRGDAEGLASLGGGRYAVSFERDHRIWAYDLGDNWERVGHALPQVFAIPPGARHLRDNSGIESLALSGGWLWAGLEYPVIDGQPHRLWRYDPDSPQTPPRAFALSLTPGFGLTALTGDGAGGLFILERFRSRAAGNRVGVLHHLDGEMLAEAGSGLLIPTPLARLEPDMTVDNFEGLAMVQTDGETRLFIMSDDNFNASQRTLLLSFTFSQ